MVRLAAPLAVMPEPSSPWGERSSGFHNGVDLPCPIGTELFALTSGTVAAELLNVDEPSGLAVIVNDDSGRVRWSFSHCSVLLVVRGDRVKRGQLIALSGNTGRVSPPKTSACPTCGAHLHLRVDVDGQNVDPWPLLQASRTRGIGTIVAAAAAVAIVTKTGDG